MEPFGGTSSCLAYVLIFSGLSGVGCTDNKEDRREIHLVLRRCQKCMVMEKNGGHDGRKFLFTLWTDVIIYRVGRLRLMGCTKTN